MKEEQNLLNDVILLLKESTTDRAKQMDRCMELLDQSEKRIQKTHEMIEKLVDVCENVTQKYIGHINSLAECRDNLLSQNKELIELLASEKKTIDEERTRYTDLVRQILAVQSLSKSTNINLK